MLRTGEVRKMAFLLSCVLYDFDSWREANVIYARVITSGVFYVTISQQRLSYCLSSNSITYNTPRPESALRRLYIACSNQSNFIVFAFILSLSFLSSLGYVTSVIELESSYIHMMCQSTDYYLLYVRVAKRWSIYLFQSPL